MRAAGAVALAAFALLAGVSHAGSGRTFAVSGSIESISAERGLVAVHVHPARGCDYVLVWGAGTLRVRDCSSSDAVIQDLTLAGGAPIWWDWSSGNHVYCDNVYFGGRPLGLCDGTQGDTYYEFAGDRTIAAIADYSVCESDCTDDNGNLLPDGDYGVEVRRIKGGKVVPLLKPVDFRRFLDARNWRVAVVEPKGLLTVYDAKGKQLWQTPGVTGVESGWIVGDSVVVQRGRAVQVYSGQIRAILTRTLPKGGHLQNAVGGLAVYTVGSTVHLLRLSDGRDRKFVTIKGLVDAQLTPAGVFYATGSVVTFVPIRDVLRKLR